MPQHTDSLLAEVFRSICEEIGVRLISVGGGDDHIHLAVNIPPALAVSEAVKMLKGKSAYLLRRTVPGYEDFKWQPGYYASTAYYPDIGRLLRYIKNQRRHHARPRSRAPRLHSRPHSRPL